MQIGYLIVIFLVISVLLALRLKNKVSRIFSVAAILSFFLVMTVVALIPNAMVTTGNTLFITSLSLVGIVFVVIVLINMLFNNLMSKPKKKTKEEGDGGK